MRILRYFAIGKPGFYIWHAIVIILLVFMVAKIKF